MLLIYSRFLTSVRLQRESSSVIKIPHSELLLSMLLGCQILQNLDVSRPYNFKTDGEAS